MREFLCCFFLVLCVPTFGVRAETETGIIDRDDQAVMASKAFLDAHPDMKFRTEGFLAFEEGRFDDARVNFTSAADFADKPSQAMLAEMAWKGIGQSQDRAMGYVWADLAAERGYRQFVVLRESYWSKMTPAEQARAMEVGQSVLERYGDASAQRRLVKYLQRARRLMIGGRPRKDVTVMVPGPYGMPTYIRGHDFYAPKFWEPKLYFEWVDAVWKDPPIENVEVGPLEGVSE